MTKIATEKGDWMTRREVLFQDFTPLRTYLNLDRVGYFMPFSENEIADVMGISQQAVSKALHSALRKLAKNATLLELVD